MGAAAIILAVSSPDHRSTWFSHDELAGVKCMRTRGWLASHCWITGVLCVA
jgi:hypothetical protein